MIITAPLQRRCPNTPTPSGRSQKGRAAALVLLCFWGSQTQTVVPVVSERRLLGAEGDKPGLSSRTRRAWLSLSQALRGPAHPPDCSPANAATFKGAPPTSGLPSVVGGPQSAGGSSRPESQDQRHENNQLSQD